MLTSNNSRMEHDYDIEKNMQKTIYSTSDIMYDKAYRYISNSLPRSMSQSNEK